MKYFYGSEFDLGVIPMKKYSTFPKVPELNHLVLGSTNNRGRGGALYRGAVDTFYNPSHLGLRAKSPHSMGKCLTV